MNRPKIIPDDRAGGTLWQIVDSNHSVINEFNWLDQAERWLDDHYPENVNLSPGGSDES